jgi:hypothetical protein
MPFSNWRAYAPAGGAVALLLVIIALGNWAGGFDSRPRDSHGDKAVNQQRDPTKPASRKHGVEAAKYQPSCDEPKSREEADVCAQRRMADAADRIVVLTWVQIVLGVIGALGLLATLWLTRAALKQASRSADAAKISADALVSAERAFVKISHNAPGIDFFEDRDITVSVEVRNLGKTPATVTDTLLKPVLVLAGESLPKKPDYARDRAMQSSKAFLVANEHFKFGDMFMFKPDTPQRLRDSDLWFYLIGYVDYVDVFGTRHRAGYARRYVPDRDEGPKETRNNLVLVADSAYTYDRPRRWGEGSD